MEYFAHGATADTIANNEHMMSGNWGWGWLMMAGITILFILLVFLVAKFATSSTNRADSTSSEDATAVLKKRYASGDITKKEFDDMKKDIQSK